MNEKTVCRLCFTSCHPTFEDVEAVTLDMLRFLGLLLDLHMSEQPVICRACSENLHKCFKFKTVCLYTEGYIKSFRNDRDNVKLNLREIYETKNKNGNIPMSTCHSICRLCMKMAESGDCTTLNEETMGTMSAEAILKRYLSELNLEITENPVICTSCNESLCTYFRLIKNSLDMKDRIEKYCETIDDGNNLHVELKNVLPFEAEYASNYENSHNDISTHENCNENKLYGEIKLDPENLMQEEPQEFHVKREGVNHDEADCVKIEELNDITGNCRVGDKTYEIALKCENTMEIESPEFKIAHEGIDVEMDDGTTSGVQDKDALEVDLSQCKICAKPLTPHVAASETAVHQCEECDYKTESKCCLDTHKVQHTTRGDALREPKLMHEKASAVTTFSCTLCTYKTKRKGYLNRHTLTHNLTNTKITGNSIDTILKANFKTLPLAEKVSIKTFGRPTPELDLNQPDRVGARTFTRHFSKDIYKKCKWICGCATVNAMFCFPCVLFYSDGMDKTWSVTGFKDLKHLNQRMKKHEISAHHIKCCTDLALLGSVNKQVKLNSVYRLSIINYNEQVTKNRYILKKVINCIKFCGKLELAISQAEKGRVQNRGILLEPIDFSSDLDAILKEELNTATVFNGTSKTLQNEVLQSMLAVCRREIKEQISEIDFLAVQSDEVTDISDQCQIVISLRYYHSGNLYERFWTVLRVTDKSAEGLTRCIEHELDELILNSPSKLIAQTYDGANVMSGVQSNVKRKYKYAQVVHCYAHELNLIMQKATSQNSKLKMFFSNLLAFPRFFSNSTNRCDVLEESENRKLPKLAATRWNYSIRTVNAVFENRENLIEFFQELEEKFNKTSTCREAYGLRRILEDPDFLFFLNIFHKIFPHVDVLFNQFQARNTDSSGLTNKMGEFEKIISSIRDSADEIENEVTNIENEMKNKRKRISPENKNTVIAEELCDAIIFQMKERLSYRGHLEAASLVNVDNFLNYLKKFPLSILRSVVESYPMLQLDKLKTELEVIYSRTDFKNIVGGLNMLSWLLENDLNETFSETVKLLKIIVTIPMPTVETERCFPTLKRTETFLRNPMDEECLNALGMMSVNKNLIHNISNFDEKVMEHFISQKNRRRDFVYKR